MNLIPDLWSENRYASNVPRRGLMIDGKPALSGIDPTRVARYVLMTVRDPLCAYDEDPAEQFAKKLDDPEVAGRTGMFTTITGNYKGVPVSVVSGGSGAPEAELVLHELFEFTEADTFIRVGGSGGIHPAVSPGDIVIATGVVRDDGMTQEYIPASFPAVSSFEVVAALRDAARDLGVAFHTGITRSQDSDFCGAGRPSARGYFQPWHTELLNTWARAGVLNGDRESSAIVTLTTLFGMRGGSVCSVADNVITGAKFEAGAGHTAAIDVALEGLVRLAAMDNQN